MGASCVASHSKHLPSTITCRPRLPHRRRQRQQVRFGSAWNATPIALQAQRRKPASNVGETTLSDILVWPGKDFVSWSRSSNCVLRYQYEALLIRNFYRAISQTLAHPYQIYLPCHPMCPHDEKPDHAYSALIIDVLTTNDHGVPVSSSQLKAAV